MRLRFNFLALDTFNRLLTTTDFINLLNDALPTKALQVQDELKLIAESGGWDYVDYEVERQSLDEKFDHWMPRLAAYSCVILLYSIVENQVQACAEQVGKMHNSRFRVQDLRGGGVDQAALYILRVAGVDVTKDSAWPEIDTLRRLRNLIVHYGGKAGEKHKDLIADLCKGYPNYVRSEESQWPPHGQIWISMNLCSLFGDHVTEFFKRLFKTLGLPEKGSEFS